MRLQLKQIALACLLTCLGAAAMATSYHFVLPKPNEMSKGSPVSVALSPSALPDAVVGLPYNGGAGFDLKSVLAVSGDSGFNPALTSFSVTSGTLPSGLTVSASGVLAGTPTVASSGSSIQVTATYKTASGAQTYQVISLNLTVTLAAATLPPATVGTQYNTTGYDFKPKLQVSGDPAYTASQASFKVADGSSLPVGLVLSANGVLSGKPSATSAGVNFTLQAAYKSQIGQQAYTLVVNGAKLQVLSISSGGNHTCAVTLAGGVKCWGEDTYGQLGNDAALVNQPTPVDVLGLTSGVTSIAAGISHTCAITAVGGIKCWGLDTSGQLGNDATLVNQPTPVDVLGLTSGATQVDAGGKHTCAVTLSGGAKCWGADSEGQLGDDVASVAKPTPTDVLGLTSGVSSISTGTNHSCVVTTGSGAVCWGYAMFGQIGASTAGLTKPTPESVVGLETGVASISAGEVHTCAVTTSGGAKCWGHDGQGAIGNDAAFVTKATPVDVLGLTSGVASISAGGHTCAVTTSGMAKCWGYDAQGQVGNDTALVNQPTPADVLGLTSGVALISTGFMHACAVTTAGDVKCWGSDAKGQLGNDATLTNQPTPVLVP